MAKLHRVILDELVVQVVDAEVEGDTAHQRLQGLKSALTDLHRTPDATLR